MNNKGFMMAEVIVVSAVILVTLVGLYTSYNKIFSVYNQRVDYYDVDALYMLANIRDNSWYPDEVCNKPVVYGNNTIYYINKNDVKNRNVDTNGLKQTFKDYLDYLSTSLDFDSMIFGEKIIKNILIMENCSDQNNCKYAYLEVLDEDVVLVPKCILSVSGTTITASVNRDDGISYIGWDTNRINDNGIMTTTIDHTGTYTFSIEDNAGNAGTCSASVSAYSLVDTEKKNCTSGNWSNKKSACSSGYTYSSNSCSRSVSSYKVRYADCWYDEATRKYVWRQLPNNYKTNQPSCSATVTSGVSLCTWSDYSAGSLAISECVVEGYNYSGGITCKKYACDGDGYTRIDDTNYCYKIN